MLHALAIALAAAPIALAGDCSQSTEMFPRFNDEGEFQGGGFLAQFTPHSLASWDFNADGLDDFAFTTQNPVDELTIIVLSTPELDVYDEVLRQPNNHNVLGFVDFYIDDLDDDGRADLIYVDQDVVTVMAVDDELDFEETYTYEMPPNKAASRDVVRSIMRDVNSDGRPDLVLLTLDRSEDSTWVEVFLTTNDGVFSPQGEYEVVSNGPATGQYLLLCVGDYNADGNPDVVSANVASAFVNSDKELLFLAGDGSFGFEPPVTIPFPAVPEGAIAPFDANGDGLDDIVVIEDGSNLVDLYLSDGPLNFTHSPFSGRSAFEDAMVLHDYTGDGLDDIFLASAMRIIPGLGDGQFADAIDQSQVVGSHHDAIPGDFDGNGVPDYAYICGQECNMVRVVYAAATPPCNAVPCFVDDDRSINAGDLAELLASWGMPGPYDYDHSGAVASDDLAIFLASWGDCD